MHGAGWGVREKEGYVSGSMEGNVQEVVGLIQGVTLFSLLFYAVYTDVTKRRIPNGLCLAGAAVGLACSYLRGGVGRVTLETSLAEQVNLMSSLAGLSFLFVLFFVAYMAGGVGAGDAKLVGAVGALVNFRFAFWSSVYIAMSGMALALILLILKGDFRGGVWRGICAAFTFRYKPKPVRTPPSGADAPPKAGVPNEAIGADNSNVSLGGTVTSGEVRQDSAGAGSGTEGAEPVPPSPAEDLAGTGSSPGGVTTLETPAPAEGLLVPYAVAVLLGVIWTSLFYVARAPLPFLPE